MCVCGTWWVVLAVFGNHRSGTMVYYEAALLDEKEFLAWVGLEPLDKDLNAKKSRNEREFSPCLVCDEEGNYKEFYLVSLEGLQPADVMSMRKIQCQYYVDIIMDEHHVPQGCQVSKDQPKNWFEFASQGHVTKLRGGGLKVSDRAKLISLSSMMAKAATIIQSREAAEEEQEAGHDESNYLDQLDDVDSSGPKHAQFADSSALLGSMQPLAKKEKKQPQSRGRRKADKGDEQEDNELELESATGSTSRLLELQKVDPELAIVAQKHQKITGRFAPKCFENLQIKDVFAEGTKSKQSAYGVWCQVGLKRPTFFASPMTPMQSNAKSE